jgi:alpha,alpha-trehalase
MFSAYSSPTQNRNKNQAPRVYVPEAEPGMKKYYERIAKLKPHLGLIVDTVPTNFTAEWVKSRNEQPGILALAMKEIKKEGEDSDFEGIPFVVPGARFNELYNVSLRRFVKPRSALTSSPSTVG